MENAADALKMAGSVLMFVIALSVSIVAFGQARQTSDVILDYKDRETEYIDGNYYYNSNQSERTVNLETIIPSIYRVYRENYKIVFEGLTYPIYTKLNTNGSKEQRFCLDSQYDSNILSGGDVGKQSFLKAVLYGKKDDQFKLLYLGIKPDGTTIQGRKEVIQLPHVSLYEQLLSATSITEYIGVYYQDETLNEPNTSPGTENIVQDDVPDSNKIEKRIITYKIN